VTPAVVAWVEATRRRQGLPPRIQNPAILDKIAAIIGVAEGVVGRAKAS
jgi:hypothetical protein